MFLRSGVSQHSESRTYLRSSLGLLQETRRANPLSWFPLQHGGTCAAHGISTRVPKTPPRAVQDSPRGPQEAPKIPKSLPRGPQGLPRAPQEAPKTPQGLPKRPPRPPKRSTMTPQEGASSFPPRHGERAVPPVPHSSFGGTCV